MSGPDLLVSVPTTRLTAVITAGGQSSRFGRDKALAWWQGQTLLEHAAQALADCPAVQESVRLLVAPAGKYTLAGWQQVADSRPGAGPLAGLEAGLSHAPTDWVALTGVDMPTLDAAYWQALARAITPEARSVQATDPQGYPQPLAALYHRSLLPRLTALLNSGERRLRLACPDEQVIRVAQLPQQYFWNINHPEDLQRLQKMTE